MVAHELATLNETREENAELKRTCEGLRKQVAVLGRALAINQRNSPSKDAPK